MEPPKFADRGHPVFGTDNPEGKSKKEKGLMDFNPEDRISPLANEILFLILREVPPRDICHMTSVSRRFSLVCTSLWSTSHYNRAIHHRWFVNFLVNSTEVGAIMRRNEKEMIEQGHFTDSERVKHQKRTDLFVNRMFNEFTVAELKTIVKMYRTPEIIKILDKLGSVMRKVLEDTRVEDQEAPPPPPIIAAPPIHYAIIRRRHSS